MKALIAALLLAYTSGVLAKVDVGQAASTAAVGTVLGVLAAFLLMKTLVFNRYKNHRTKGERLAYLSGWVGLIWIGNSLIPVGNELAMSLIGGYPFRQEVFYRASLTLVPLGVIHFIVIKAVVFLFDSRNADNKISSEQKNMGADDGALYASAMQELDQGNKEPGMWAKAFSEAMGDLEKAKALYIKYQVDKLRSEVQASSNEEVWTEPEPEPLNRGIGMFPLILIGGLLLAIGYQLIRWVSGQPPQ